MNAVNLIIAVLTLIFSGIAAWGPITIAIRKPLLRSRLNEHFQDFSDALYNDVAFLTRVGIDAVSNSEGNIEWALAKGRIARIKEDLFNKLGPTKVEKRVFLRALDSYEELLWKHVSKEISLEDDVMETNTSSARQKELWAELDREKTNLKTRFYNDILYWRDSGE